MANMIVLEKRIVSKVILLTSSPDLVIDQGEQVLQLYSQTDFLFSIPFFFPVLKTMTFYLNLFPDVIHNSTFKT